MSGKYDSARQGFGDGSLSWTKDKFIAQLVTAGYVFDAKHANAQSITGAIGVGISISGRQIPAGWAKCDQLIFKAVPGDGQTEVVAIVIHRESKESAHETLVVYLSDISNFPMRPNGGDIIIDVPSPGLFRV